MHVTTTSHNNQEKGNNTQELHAGQFLEGCNVKLKDVDDSSRELFLQHFGGNYFQSKYNDRNDDNDNTMAMNENTDEINYDNIDTCKEQHRKSRLISSMTKVSMYPNEQDTEDKIFKGCYSKTKDESLSLVSTSTIRGFPGKESFYLKKSNLSTNSGFKDGADNKMTTKYESEVPSLTKVFDGHALNELSPFPRTMNVGVARADTVLVPCVSSVNTTDGTDAFVRNGYIDMNKNNEVTLEIVNNGDTTTKGESRTDEINKNNPITMNKVNNFANNSRKVTDSFIYDPLHYTKVEDLTLEQCQFMWIEIMSRQHKAIVKCQVHIKAVTQLITLHAQDILDDGSKHPLKSDRDNGVNPSPSACSRLNTPKPRHIIPTLLQSRLIRLLRTEVPPRRLLNWNLLFTLSFICYFFGSNHFDDDIEEFHDPRVMLWVRYRLVVIIAAAITYYEVKMGVLKWFYDVLITRNGLKRIWRNEDVSRAREGDVDYDEAMNH